MHVGDFAGDEYNRWSGNKRHTPVITFAVLRQHSYSHSSDRIFKITAFQKLTLGGLFYQFNLPDEKGVIIKDAASTETSAAMLAVRQVHQPAPCVAPSMALDRDKTSKAHEYQPSQSCTTDWMDAYIMLLQIILTVLKCWPLPHGTAHACTGGCACIDSYSLAMHDPACCCGGHCLFVLLVLAHIDV